MFQQDGADRVFTDFRQPVGDFPQGLTQRFQGPSRGAIRSRVRGALKFLQDARPLGRPVLDRRPPTMPWLQRLQPFALEAAHQCRHRIARFAARLLCSLHVRSPSRHGQDLLRPHDMTGGFTLRAADPHQPRAFFFSQGA